MSQQNGRLESLIRELQGQKSASQRAFLARFFKTGPGEYAAGDVFWGLSVPVQRRIARGYYDLKLPDLARLLKSPVHEQRFVALVILIYQYEKAPTLEQKKKFFDFYWRHRAGVNNWDLVDMSAPRLYGDYLGRSGQGSAHLLQLAASPNLWIRRISMVATLAFIKQGRTKETFAVARALLRDPHDLIHKATGWMLREAGKHGREDELLAFLDRWARKMPRTALRYALEHLSPERRRHYLNIKKVV